MAKNYESENKAKNYTTDKTSNSRNAMDSQRTKLPMHMMHTTKHRMIILTDTKENCR